MAKKQTNCKLRLLATLMMGALLSLCAWAQITVNGNVKDSIGNPVNGAHVYARGTEIVSTTDVNGNFTMAGVPEGTVIDVHMPDGSLQKAMPAAASMDITMTPEPAAVAPVQPATTQPAAQPVPEEPVVKELKVWELTKAGGWLMIPLALLAIISIYIFFERFFVINRASRTDADTFMEKIKNLIHRGEVDQALTLCKETNTPYARMIEKGVSRIGRPMNDVLVAIENVGNMEIARLEKGFNWLATTAAGAPMIGFLGTVTGMVQAFFQLASAGNNSNVTILASGIYQALVTTVAGLIVGILALFAYNYLTSRVNKVMNKLEGKTMEFMDLLNEPAK